MLSFVMFVRYAIVRSFVRSFVRIVY